MPFAANCSACSTYPGTWLEHVELKAPGTATTRFLPFRPLISTVPFSTLSSLRRPRFVGNLEPWVNPLPPSALPFIFSMILDIVVDCDLNKADCFFRPARY